MNKHTNCCCCCCCCWATPIHKKVGKTARKKENRFKFHNNTRGECCAWHLCCITQCQTFGLKTDQIPVLTLSTSSSYLLTQRVNSNETNLLFNSLGRVSLQIMVLSQQTLTCRRVAISVETPKFCKVPINTSTLRKTYDKFLTRDELSDKAFVTWSDFSKHD